MTMPRKLECNTTFIVDSYAISQILNYNKTTQKVNETFYQ